MAPRAYCYEGHDFLGADRVPLHYKRLGHFAGFIVRNADDRSVRDGRMPEQDRLNMCRSDLVALVLDEFLESVDHKEMAIVIEVANIAGSQPPVGINHGAR